MLVGKRFLLVPLPVFQVSDTDHLDQRVLDGRALLFVFFKSIVEQTSPNSPSDILGPGWN